MSDYDGRHDTNNFCQPDPEAFLISKGIIESLVSDFGQLMTL